MENRSIRSVAILALALVALMLTGSELRAGKIMRAAKWAAGEAVKAALVEYAKHEANGSFEAFKQNFCTHKEYRTKVLSSPAVSPLIVDQGSAEDLILETLGCGYELGKINVVFTGATPKTYESGDTTCELTANIRNYSKHHLNKLIFEVGTWRFEVGDMVANSYEDDVLMSRIKLGKATCASQARYLVDNLKDAAALECSIPNVAEGDCQGLVSFTTTLNAEALARIGAEESSLADKRQRAEEATKANAKAEREKLRSLNLKGGEGFQYVSDKDSLLPWSTNMEKRDGYNFGISRGYLVRILAVHKEADGIDDFYKVKLIPPGYTPPETFWTPAPNFNEHRSSMTRLSEAQERAQANVLCRQQAVEQVRSSCDQQAAAAGLQHLLRLQSMTNCMRANESRPDEVCKATSQ